MSKLVSLDQFTVCVDWVALPLEHNDWNASRYLYAYLAPDEVEILYIGMTWDQTIGARWNYSAKPAFWRYLRRDRRLTHHITLAGHIDLAPGRRLSKALLIHIESLLINDLQPGGNIQATASRTSRPGMVVQCLGPAWPGPRHFYDP